MVVKSTGDRYEAARAWDPVALQWRQSYQPLMDDTTSAPDARVIPAVAGRNFQAGRPRKVKKKIRSVWTCYSSDGRSSVWDFGG